MVYKSEKCEINITWKDLVLFYRSEVHKKLKFRSSHVPQDKLAKNIQPGSLERVWDKTNNMLEYISENLTAIPWSAHPGDKCDGLSLSVLHSSPKMFFMSVKVYALNHSHLVTKILLPADGSITNIVASALSTKRTISHPELSDRSNVPVQLLQIHSYKQTICIREKRLSLPTFSFLLSQTAHCPTHPGV